MKTLIHANSTIASSAFAAGFSAQNLRGEHLEDPPGIHVAVVAHMSD